LDERTTIRRLRTLYPEIFSFPWANGIASRARAVLRGNQTAVVNRIRWEWKAKVKTRLAEFDATRPSLVPMTVEPVTMEGRWYLVVARQIVVVAVGERKKGLVVEEEKGGKGKTRMGDDVLQDKNGVERCVCV
jgi:hypothetical protein